MQGWPRKLFGEVPANMQIKMLEKAVLDKDFMTLLLTKSKKTGRSAKVSRHCSNLSNRGRFNIT